MRPEKHARVPGSVGTEHGIEVATNQEACEAHEDVWMQLDLWVLYVRPHFRKITPLSSLAGVDCTGILFTTTTGVMTLGCFLGSFQFNGLKIPVVVLSNLVLQV